MRDLDKYIRMENKKTHQSDKVETLEALLLEVRQERGVAERAGHILGPSCCPKNPRRGACAPQLTKLYPKLNLYAAN